MSWDRIESWVTAWGVVVSLTIAAACLLALVAVHIGGAL